MGGMSPNVKKGTRSWHRSRIYSLYTKTSGQYKKEGGRGDSIMEGDAWFYS